MSDTNKSDSNNGTSNNNVPNNSASKKAISKTIQNLAKAFSCEMKVCARYIQFAERAQQEEYYSLAALFRACSFSEQVHASCLGKVTLFMGGSLHTELLPSQTKDIPNMIEDMLSEEENAMDDYPRFIEEAGQENMTTPVPIFTIALKTDTIHSLLCQAAAQSQDHWKSESRTFYTCAQCGLIREYRTGICPVCGGPESHFHVFSAESFSDPVSKK